MLREPLWLMHPSMFGSGPFLSTEQGQTQNRRTWMDPFPDVQDLVQSVQVRLQ